MKKTVIYIMVSYLIMTSIPIDAVEMKPDTGNSTKQTSNGSERNDYETNWDEISALLDQHTGVYTNTSPISDNTGVTPDGPLMGNSTVYAFLGSNSPDVKKKQYIYISRADSWEDVGRSSFVSDTHYVGFGGLTITRTDSSDKVSDFRLEQNMKLAEVSGTSESGFQTRTFLAANKNVMISEITNLTDADMNLEVALNGLQSDKATLVYRIDQEAGMMYLTKKHVSNRYNWTVNNTIATKVLGKQTQLMQDAQNVRMQFSINGNETVRMVTAIEGGKNSQTSETDAANTILAHDTAEKIAVTQAQHQEWWKNYWLRSYVSLDTKSDLWERLYLGLIYQEGCAVNAESENDAGLTAGLFPWTANPIPNWSGDYTLNTDVQRALITSLVANRTGFVENYADVIQDFWAAGTAYASDPAQLNAVAQGSKRANFTKGIRGVLFPTHIGPWGSKTENYPPASYARNFWCSPSNATMAVMPLVKYYNLTLDQEFMQSRLYPMVKDIANFWTDYAMFNEVTGKYDIYGSSIEETQARPNPNLDLSACYFLMKNAIDMSIRLGADGALRAEWENVYNNLADFPFAVENGKEYYSLEEGRGVPAAHGLPWSVYGLSLFDLKGTNSDPEEVTRVVNWLTDKQRWNSAKAYRGGVLAARFGIDPVDYLTKVTNHLINVPVGDWTGIRSNNTVGDIGGTLSMDIVQESLMQSHQGFIEVFPNWFQDQEASFKNLRAYGAFTVSASQNRTGTTNWVSIKSEKGSSCSVVNPWQGQEIKVIEDGNQIEAVSSTNRRGEVVTFPTKAGSIYEIKLSDIPAPTISLDQNTLSIVKNQQGKLTAVTNGEHEIVWASDDPNIAVVSSSGSVLGLQDGTTDITATVKGTEVSASCAVTVISNLNVARDKPAEAVSVHENFTADKAFDGRITEPGDQSSGIYWVSRNAEYTQPRWIKVDLKSEYTISRWMTNHIVTAGSINDRKTITRDYELQVSEDGTDWQTVDTVTDNTNILTDRNLDSPVTGRYFRLYITKADNFNGAWPGNNARIDELQLFSAITEQDWNVEAVPELSPLTVPFGTDLSTFELPRQIEVTLNQDVSANIPVDWQTDSYRADQAGTYTLTGRLVLPERITNTNDLTVNLQVTVQEKPQADKSSLMEQIQTAQSQKDSAQYQFVILSAKILFEASLKTAVQVLNQPDAKQEAVDQAYQDLTEKMKLLLQTGDKTALRKLYDTLSIADTTKYEQARLPEFQTALKAAGTVISNPNALQPEIDKAHAELNQSYQNLVEKVYVSEIRLNRSEVLIGMDTEISISAEVLPIHAGDRRLVWTSSDDGVATVSESGVVKGIKRGKARISAVSMDGSAKRATCLVTVGDKINYNLNKGVNNKLNVTGYVNDKSGKLYSPSRKGYVFIGWYTDKKYSKKITAIKKNDNGTISLYAKWEKVKVDTASLKKLESSKKRSLRVEINKIKNASGYEIQYATDKKFTKNMIAVQQTGRTKTIKELTSKSNYYVRVRAYRTDSAGEKVFGRYSAAKKIKIR